MSSGTICIALQEQTRYHSFTQCYHRLETPEGWAHATHSYYDGTNWVETNRAAADI